MFHLRPREPIDGEPLAENSLLEVMAPAKAGIRRRGQGEFSEFGAQSRFMRDAAAPQYRAAHEPHPPAVIRATPSCPGAPSQLLFFHYTRPIAALQLAEHSF